MIVILYSKSPNDGNFLNISAIPAFHFTLLTHLRKSSLFLLVEETRALNLDPDFSYSKIPLLKFKLQKVKSGIFPRKPAYKTTKR